MRTPVFGASILPLPALCLVSSRSSPAQISPACCRVSPPALWLASALWMRCKLREYPLLPHEKVCYVGQPIAVVVAHDPVRCQGRCSADHRGRTSLGASPRCRGRGADDAPVIHEALGERMWPCVCVSVLATWTGPLHRLTVWCVSAMWCNALSPPRWKRAACWPRINRRETS